MYVVLLMKCQVCKETLPCFNHIPDLYGWLIDSVIVIRPLVSIYEVYHVSDTERKTPWVLKAIAPTPRQDIEIETVQQLALRPVQNAVEFPKFDGALLQGSYGSYQWYVMKYYPYTLAYQQIPFESLSYLARCCLRFMKDLHHEHDLIYKDWRPDNIFTMGGVAPYIVADYDYCCQPRDNDERTWYKEYEETCGRDEFYYFLQRGADPHAPLNRFRLDFEGLGFMLMSFVWPVEPIWYKHCNKKRDHYDPDLLTMDEIVADREESVNSLLTQWPSLYAYFQKIKECSWYRIPPMSESWYSELASLFEVSILSPQEVDHLSPVTRSELSSISSSSVP